MPHWTQNIGLATAKREQSYHDMSRARTAQSFFRHTHTHTTHTQHTTKKDKKKHNSTIFITACCYIKKFGEGGEDSFGFIPNQTKSGLYIVLWYLSNSALSFALGIKMLSLNQTFDETRAIKVRSAAM